MLRDGTGYNFSLFLRIWARIFGVLGTGAAFFAGFLSLAFLGAIIGSIILSIPIFLVIHTTGDIFPNLLYGIGQKPTRREQLNADIEKARQYIREHDYAKAERYLKLLLREEKELQEDSELLFLLAKAQIGFGRFARATRNLRRVIHLTEIEDPLHRWARNVMKDISSKKNARSARGNQSKLDSDTQESKKSAD